MLSSGFDSLKKNPSLAKSPLQRHMATRKKPSPTVDTAEAKAVFRVQYRIPNSVEIQHCEEGEWLVLNRPPESMVIPIITFIEGKMELPMWRVTKDYLINYRLTPTQCFPNIFRILGCVDVINCRMGTNHT